MSLVAFMDGTQCEKAHTLYMEDLLAIVIHVLDYQLILVYLDFASFSCLAGFDVLFSTRVFLIGNPYLIDKEGEVHWTTFPHSGILAKLPPLATL